MTLTKLIDKAAMMEEIRKMISEGKSVTITLKGNSMNPFIVHSRDMMTLGPWQDKDICRGTVALVKDIRGNYIIHRIIKREGNQITLLGDGNVIQTEVATLDNVIGIMHSLTRKGRTYTPKSLTWRLYSAVWMFLTPVRRYPLGIWRRIFPQPKLAGTK